MELLLSHQYYWHRRVGYLLTAMGGFLVIYFAARHFIGDYALAGLSDDGVRLIAHVLGYGALAWLTAKAFGNRYLVSGGICCLLAAGDEIHQAFIPYRVGAFSDWLVDALGITAFLLAGWLLEPLVRRWIHARAAPRVKQMRTPLGMLR